MFTTSLNSYFVNAYVLFRACLSYIYNKLYVYTYVLLQYLSQKQKASSPKRRVRCNDVRIKRVCRAMHCLKSMTISRYKMSIQQQVQEVQWQFPDAYREIIRQGIRIEQTTKSLSGRRKSRQCAGALLKCPSCPFAQNAP
jgi:hypothetical protein